MAAPDSVVEPAAVPTDPNYALYQGYLGRMAAPSAWDLTTGSKSVTVCIIDSGISVGHPDLAGNIDQPAGIDATTVDWTSAQNTPGWYLSVSLTGALCALVALCCICYALALAAEMLRCREG